MQSDNPPSVSNQAKSTQVPTPAVTALPTPANPSQLTGPPQTLPTRASANIPENTTIPPPVVQSTNPYTSGSKTTLQNGPNGPYPKQFSNPHELPPHHCPRIVAARSASVKTQRPHGAAQSAGPNRSTSSTKHVAYGAPTASRSRTQMVLERTPGMTTSSRHPPAQHPTTQRDLGDVASAYAANLREQVNVAQAASALGGNTGIPSQHVETHHTNLMEELQAKSYQSLHQARETDAALKKEVTQREDLQKELHELRKLVASERQKNLEFEEQRTLWLRERETMQHERETHQREASSSQDRYGLLNDEIDYLKKELAASREREQQFIRHSTGAEALPPINESTIPPHQKSCCTPECSLAPGQATTTESVVAAAVARGIVPSHVAEKIVADYQRMLCDSEVRGAQVKDLKHQVEERDKLVDQLKQSLNAKQDELCRLVDQVRHEEQRYHMLVATTETCRLRLDDAERETQFLQNANASLIDDMKRIGGNHEQLFEKMKSALEERHIRDAQLAQAVENSKNVQSESARLLDGLKQEQEINKSLRTEFAEKAAEVEQLQAEVKLIKGRYDNLVAEVKRLDDNYKQRMREAENSLRTLTTSQQQAQAAEKTLITSTQALLEHMQNDAKQVQDVIKRSTSADGATAVAAVGPVSGGLSPRPGTSLANTVPSQTANQPLPNSTAAPGSATSAMPMTAAPRPTGSTTLATGSTVATGNIATAGSAAPTSGAMSSLPASRPIGSAAPVASASNNSQAPGAASSSGPPSSLQQRLASRNSPTPSTTNPPPTSAQSGSPLTSVNPPPSNVTGSVISNAGSPPATTTMKSAATAAVAVSSMRPAASAPVAQPSISTPATPAAQPPAITNSLGHAIKSPYSAADLLASVAASTTPTKRQPSSAGPPLGPTVPVAVEPEPPAIDVDALVAETRSLMNKEKSFRAEAESAVTAASRALTTPTGARPL